MKSYYEKYWLGTLEREDALYADPPCWPETETERILKAMSGYISGRVIDIGCGDGELAHIISQRLEGLELYGVDLAEAAVQQAHQRVGRGLNLAVGDVVHLPFANESFDCALLVEVIEHVFDVLGLLSEIARVLRPNGVVFITTTDFNMLKKFIISCFYFDRYFYPTNPHIRFFTKKTLEDVLKKRGFEPVHYQWNGDYFRIMPMGQIMIARKMIP